MLTITKLEQVKNSPVSKWIGFTFTINHLHVTYRKLTLFVCAGSAGQRLLPGFDHRWHQLPPDWPGDLWHHQPVPRPHGGCGRHRSAGRRSAMRGTCFFCVWWIIAVVQTLCSDWTVWYILCVLCFSRRCSMAQKTTLRLSSSRWEPGGNISAPQLSTAWAETLVQVGDGRRPQAPQQGSEANMKLSLTWLWFEGSKHFWSHLFLLCIYSPC